MKESYHFKWLNKSQTTVMLVVAIGKVRITLAFIYSWESAYRILPSGHTPEIWNIPVLLVCQEWCVSWTVVETKVTFTLELLVSPSKTHASAFSCFVKYIWAGMKSHSHSALPENEGLVWIPCDPWCGLFEVWNQSKLKSFLHRESALSLHWKFANSPPLFL